MLSLAMMSLIVSFCSDMEHPDRCSIHMQKCFPIMRQMYPKYDDDGIAENCMEAYQDWFLPPHNIQ